MRIPLSSTQAQAVVTEAIIGARTWGDSVIVHASTAPKRSECIIEIGAAHDVRAVNAALAVARRFLDPPSVNEADPLDVGAIVAAERAWVGL